MSYKLLQLPRAKRQLIALEKTHNPSIGAIFSKIDALQREPRPTGVEKLAAQPQWRIRVGDYRIIYAIDDASQTITITAVAHRREVYR